MPLVKYHSVAWLLRKTAKNLLDVLQRNCLIVLGARLTDRISNSRLSQNCGSTPLSRAVIRERLRWLGCVLRIMDENCQRLPRLLFFIVESDWRATKPPTVPNISPNISNQSFGIAILFHLVERFKYYVFEDDSPPQPSGQELDIMSWGHTKFLQKDLSYKLQN